MLKTWLVVAETSRARIFSIDNKAHVLHEIEDSVDTASRAYSRDLTSDRPGRNHDSTGRGRHAMEAETDPKKNEAANFAKGISERLERARIQNDFQAIVLVASPPFLGLLRQHLGENTKKCVTKTISKTLVQKSEKEIRKYLF